MFKLQFSIVYNPHTIVSNVTWVKNTLILRSSCRKYFIINAPTKEIFVGTARNNGGIRGEQNFLCELSILEIFGGNLKIFTDKIVFVCLLMNHGVLVIIDFKEFLCKSPQS